ncbi:MAG: aspartate aminotransferase family protein, partial [Gemmatimonadetes bacterium]|nr:aspartate aminotransferase family protein [Gemmatimonadota bacterium]
MAWDRVAPPWGLTHASRSFDSPSPARSLAASIPPPLPVSSILHRSLAARLPTAVHGEGMRLTLDNGQEVLDASGGAAVACLGHGNARVAAAIGAQASRMAYAHTGFFTSAPAEALADLLVGRRPGGLTHAFFVSSGSEAVESALKLARQYHVERGEPQRVHYVSRRQSYHGASLASLAVGGNLGRRRPYEDILMGNVSRVSPCFAYHGQGADETDAAYVARLAQELEAEFVRIGPQRVIAFLAETVVGATAGCVTAVPGYFAAVREVCDRHGVLLILDEIMCGMGRTGTVHAWEQEGVVPDIQVIAKGMGGGYVPIGGLLVSARVIDGLSAGSGAFVHGHTYQAHPVACAGALEVQRIIAEDGLVARAASRGAYLRERLGEVLGQHPHVGDIRGRGLFLAVEFVEDRALRRPFPAAARVHER